MITRKRIALLTLATLIAGGCVADNSHDDDTPGAPTTTQRVDHEGFVVDPVRPSDAEYRALGLAKPEEHPFVNMVEAPPSDVLAERELRVIEADLPEELEESLAARGFDKKVIGGDDRTKIGNTTVHPFSTIATLLVTFPGYDVGLCTGSLIAKNRILTAGHCIYDRETGKYATSVRVIPGRYADAAGKAVEKFGSTYSTSGAVPNEYKTTPSGWSLPQYDYGVLRLAADIAANSPPGIRAYGILANPALNRFVNVVGYHKDLCAVGPCDNAAVAVYPMYTSSDQIRANYTGFFNHYADTYKGSSGAPVVTDGADYNRIFAIHVAGKTHPTTGAEWNIATLITSTSYANIQAWAR